MFLLKYLLGTFCLMNFIYRFYLLLSCGSMYLNTPIGLYSILFLHGIFSISSSKLFGLRSIIITILHYYEFNYKYIIIIQYSVLFLSDIMSEEDIINKQYDKIENTFDPTISEIDKTRIIKMYSTIDIATTIFMLGNINSAFSPLFAIQLSDILMILVKNSNHRHLLYSAGLFVNILLFPTFSPTFLLYLSFILNIHTHFNYPYKINKYIAWGIYYAIFIVLQEYGYETTINDFWLKRYFLWWILVKFWIIGKSVSFETYLKCFYEK